MEQRPGVGRGRGIGRGAPLVAAPAAPELAELPSPTTPLVPVSAGRGRGIAPASIPSAASSLSGITVPSLSSATISEAPTPTPTALGRGFGRGVGRSISITPAGDGSPMPGSPSAAAAAPAQAQAEISPTVARGRGRALAAEVTPTRLTESMAKMDVGAAPQQPAAPTSAPAAGPIPTQPKRAEGAAREGRGERGDRPERPPDLEGEAGALAEKERREKELRFVQKPKGTLGRKVDLLGNVVRFEAAATAMVYEYRVDFYPQTWSPRLRPKLIEQVGLPGAYLFDFDNLFLAEPLQQEEQDFIVESPFGEKQKYKLTIRRVMQNKANESKELLNLIVKQLELALKFVQIGRNRYNPQKRVALQEGNMPKLEIWPGFQSSVNPFSGGILLMTDPAFRVVRVGNVKQLIDSWRKAAGARDEQFQKSIKDNLLGSTVLTPYNDKSYVVSEIVWDQTPLSTFDTPQGPVSYVQYYKQHHNLDIQDTTQPLMFSRPTPTGTKRRDNRLIALIPELCQLTGIQDDLRANFTAMKAITTTTKLSPEKRYEFIMEYLNNLLKTTEAQEVMKSWGIKISTELLRMPGRVLPPEQIYCGANRGPVTVPDNGDWTRNATGSILLGAMPLKNWTLIFQNRDSKSAEDFDKMLREVGRSLGMDIGNPKVLALTSDTNITYTNSVTTAVKEHKSEMVVFIFPTPRDDRYAAVKKSCYVVHGIASQCINQRTLSKPDRMRAIVQKIAMQINCKLGGHLWRMGKFALRAQDPDEPMKLMVIGMDAYHDLKRQRDSVTAMVASTDDDFTHWHSRCNFQSPKSELGTGIKISFMSALNSYVKVNRVLPNTIVILRDGLSDNELDQALNFELPQIVETCRDPTVVLELLGNDSSGSESSSSQEADYAPEIYFLVVQKRINQRMFLIEKGDKLVNPKPGTVCDEVITRRDMYDFYLVPQNVREGSVSPVHFIVVHQPQKPRLSVDDLQSLAYKLTHLYYNWTGTIRVPAPCMYAHKLAYQSGACYDRTEPKIEMADKLFFL